MERKRNYKKPSIKAVKVESSGMIMSSGEDAVDDSKL